MVSNYKIVGNYDFFLDYYFKYAILLMFEYINICSNIGPIVYRLGHKLFKLGSRVRLPVGSPIRELVRALEKGQSNGS